MATCHYVGCHCKVANNVYMCSPHMEYGHCNFIDTCGKKCKSPSYFYTYCVKHCYMDLRYIILYNEKIILQNTLCEAFTVNNIYVCYDKCKLICKYQTFAKIDKTVQYYELMTPRWVLMYLIFNYYISTAAAKDVFTNVANYYIYL